MSLVNFSESSLTQLKSLIGSFGNSELEREFISSVPYVESRWFKVTDEVEVTVGEDTSTEYKAEEVYPDGTTVSAGIVFDSDATPSNKPSDPTYFKNLKINTELYTGAIEVNKAYQVEAVWSNDANGEIVYYIIPKGGGGGGTTAPTELTVTTDFLATRNLDAVGVAKIANTETVVNIRQGKFPTAQFYNTESLWGWLIDGDNLDNPTYDVSATLHGVGLT